MSASCSGRRRADRKALSLTCVNGTSFKEPNETKIIDGMAQVEKKVEQL